MPLPDRLAAQREVQPEPYVYPEFLGDDEYYPDGNPDDVDWDSPGERHPAGCNCRQGDCPEWIAFVHDVPPVNEVPF
jgi:hypothetical protein